MSTDQHDPDVRWIVAIPHRTSSAQTVRAYLYSHTTEVGTVSEGFGDVMIMVTTGHPGEFGHAEFLARYQADRIKSGGHRAWVCTTYADARRLVETEMAEMAARL
jgi:hypothetical protein